MKRKVMATGFLIWIIPLAILWLTQWILGWTFVEHRPVFVHTFEVISLAGILIFAGSFIMEDK